MAYNNGYNSGYSRNGSYNNGKRSYGSNQRSYTKKSGAGIFQWESKDGRLGKAIFAWRADRRNGFMKLSAYWMSEKGLKEVNKIRKDNGQLPVSLIHKADSGREYHRMLVKVHYKDKGEFKNFTGFYNKATHQLRIPALGHVVNVKKSVWVKSRKPRNNRR